jgi:hypothetical protein
MFRSDTGIIQSGGDGVGRQGFALLIRHQVAFEAVDDARFPAQIGAACCPVSRPCPAGSIPISLTPGPG